MSGRGIDFLENWVNTNVAEADCKGSQHRASERAVQCYAQAAELGISVDDMEPGWGSVEEIIYDAMQDVLGDELEFWKGVAAMRERRKKGTTLQ